MALQIICCIPQAGGFSSCNLGTEIFESPQVSNSRNVRVALPKKVTDRVQIDVFRMGQALPCNKHCYIVFLGEPHLDASAVNARPDTLVLIVQG